MNINKNFFSPNYSSPRSGIDHIILHYTEMEFKDALEKLVSSSSEVSCHYLIKKDGEIFQLVEDEMIAWHAGHSSWRGRDKLNQSSIGIELDNLGNESFSPHQMNACMELCWKLVSKHSIDSRNILGHSDIAPTRKIDPGIFFNWQLLAQNGLGLWHKVEYSETLDKNILYKFGDQGEEIKKIQLMLQKIGYGFLTISGQIDIETNAVIRAFQAHFCPKIIHAHGSVDFYNNINSYYCWNELSHKILLELVGTV